MFKRSSASYLFRAWILAHGRPLRFYEMRPLWREVRRFIADQASGI
jgi:hypothetical protein